MGAMVFEQHQPKVMSRFFWQILYEEKKGSMGSDSSLRPKSFTGRTLVSVTKENVLDSSGADLVRKMGKPARSKKTCSVPWLKTSATR